jgi:serine/threonine protein kinase
MQVLFDFGLSKLVRIKTGTTAHKLTGQVGAIRYMAPEARPLGLTRGKLLPISL